MMRVILTRHDQVIATGDIPQQKSLPEYVFYDGEVYKETSRFSGTYSLIEGVPVVEVPVVTPFINKSKGVVDPRMFRTS